jgi:predicted phosphodiesterase
MKIVYTSDLHYGFSKETQGIHKTFYANVAKEKPDLYMIIGDIGSDQYKHFETALRMAKEYLTCPIVITRGNHDLWDNINDLNYIFTNGKSFMDKLGVTDINEQVSMDIGPAILLGWEGWYGVDELCTNDINWIRLNKGDTCGVFDNCHRFLQKRGYDNFGKMLLELDAVQNKRPDKKIIVMSHMPIFNHNPSDPDDIGHDGPHSYWQFIKGKTDYFMYGHTHQFCDRFEDGIHVLNSGSNYNKPRYAKLEL